MKIRAFKQAITSMQINGTLARDMSEIKQQMVQFYMDLFTTSHSSIQGDISIISCMIPKLISLEQNSDLMASTENSIIIYGILLVPTLPL